MNSSAPRNPAKPTIALFALLFAIGSTYLASLAYFLAKDTNFIDTEKAASATRFAQSTHLSLPASLSFTTTSGWSRALSTGWNKPESWGVWSNRSTAIIVLPAIQDTSLASACFFVEVDTTSKIPRWPMLVTVDGHPLAPAKIFQGDGPYEIRGSAPVQPGHVIHLQLSGPKPIIPNLLSHHVRDARDLAFRLMGIAVTARCDSTQ